MKTKKILSVLLAIVMIASVMSVGAYADDVAVYTDSATYSIKPKATLNPDNFSATLNIDYSKISTLDGGTVDVTGHVISVVATHTSYDGSIHTADYVADPDAFFAIFDKVVEDVAYVKEYNANNEEKLPDIPYIELAVETEVRIGDPRAFGILNYTIDVVGFSEPMSIGIGPVDDLLSGVAVPVNISFPGTVEDFPSIASKTITGRPIKTDYTDAEKFDPTGLAFDITLTNGETGTFTYSEENSHMFICTPTKNEKLTTYDTQVVVEFLGEQVSKVPITVVHQFSQHYVSITTDKYFANKPGYHALVCEGCGETHDAQPHVVADEDAWTPNGDQSFLANGTESNICEVCKTTLIRDAHGSADYNDALADYHFIRVILDYINMLLNIINGTMR
ncbi:MAG: hypothetical protein UGF89_08795 [Acutalibacteraceae bacterium]|nr:hypothetical protein [Acutalibacteraceae bacterium]